MFFSPGCQGGEGREEGKEVEFGEGLGMMDEDMSVGESIKATFFYKSSDHVAHV